MSLLNVLIYPDEQLRTLAEPVTAFNDDLQTLIDNMFETMYEHEGIGLAATQVNVHQRVIVIDIEGDKANQLVLINPEILESTGETGIEEGCLSIPGFRGLVPRKETVKVQALNRQGDTVTFEADGLLAICIQHEIDHLNGVLFVDYLSPLKRNRIKEKLVKLQKQMARGNA
ncbi:peptide deformylase [Lonepinella sp. BR2474]|uniref:peptide deformylase n=1 Tax=Lonepinella sp. BR2474 TaxID=3434548 RepID=UPI003F6DB1B8